jgi:hypothetical protein
MMLAHVGWRRREGAPPITMLISRSRDGAAIAEAVEMLGLRAIRGSTDRPDKKKGGAEALRALLRELKEGRSVSVTPDGPKGPRMRAQEGAVQLAKLSGAPIVCLGWSVTGRRVLSSWDSFVLPMPFARGVFVWGGPIRIPREADAAATEAARLALECELTRVVQEADRLVGLNPVQPATAEAASA